MSSSPSSYANRSEGRSRNEQVETLLIDGLESGEPLEVTADYWTRKRKALGSPRQLRDPHLKGMRARPVAGFRKALPFDLTFDDAVEVVRVLHGARDIPSLLDHV